MGELLTMSNKELDRAGVMLRLVERRLSQEAAAETLGVCVRQVRRLLRAYEAKGAASWCRSAAASRALEGSLMAIRSEFCAWW
jgi:hypothetical protein